MAHCYLAYIDESGDDGLENFRGLGGRGGASSWLVISATVVRAEHDRSMVAWRDEILDGMPKKKTRQIHFATMSHGQKVAACQSIAKRPLRAINVIANKQVIPPDTYTGKNQLYFYMTRYLIERVSWLCRDYQRAGDANCAVKIMFSRRGGMSYQNFQDYMRRLRAQETNIYWPSIDIDAIDAQDHSRVAALQLSDAVASGFAAGFEPDTLWELRNPLRRDFEESHIPICDKIEDQLSQLRRQDRTED